MLLERRTVSRKTPLDGKLEISAATASRLATLGASFPLRLDVGTAIDDTARLHELSCTCTKAAASGQHTHHFVESVALRSLEEGSEVRVELDDARPGSLSIRSVLAVS
ncbi:MAG: hypothetical protein M3Y05_13060 [Gemmatimonadota bacterium]|nr:hypothetical protein [Gemmatimonadota bacterium]